MTEARPAFYALAPGGWRDYVTLLHPPYTLWHLSYVVVGAAIAPHFDGSLLAWTLLAFFLAMGIGAHALDELRGRPLQTRIAAPVLVALAVASVAGAAAIGIAVSVERDLWLLAFVAVGCLFVVAYNLEVAGGVLHNNVGFAAGWGAFPVLTAYFASAHTIRGEAVAAAGFAAALSAAQRILSTPVREIRRRTAHVGGRWERVDGTTTEIDAATLMHPEETALRLLSTAAVLLAVALVLVRVT